MKNYGNKKRNDKVTISLLLCFCVVALVSIFSIKSNISKIEDSAKSSLASKPVQTEQNTQNNDIPKESTANFSTAEPTQENDNVNDSTSSDTNTDEVSKFVMPIKDFNDKLLKNYSMDSLVYSKTLDQYMTHSGIDIEASQKTEVFAIAEGTVTKIYSDNGYGTTVEIDHGKGLIARYSNLDSKCSVEVGDVVKKGQKIGTVGNTSMFEKADNSHLHFEMLKDDKFINPNDFLKTKN